MAMNEHEEIYYSGTYDGDGAGTAELSINVLMYGSALITLGVIYLFFQQFLVCHFVLFVCFLVCFEFLLLYLVVYRGLYKFGLSDVVSAEVVVSGSTDAASVACTRLFGFVLIYS